MNITLSAATQRMLALLGAAAILIGAVALPERMLQLVPVIVLGFAALALYQFPRALALVLILSCGLGLDIQTEMMGGIGGSVGAAAVKTIPFALAGVLLLRYGPAREVNWPFIAFLAVAGLSIAILPIGHIATEMDMLRTLIGSTAPFALGFVLAPRKLWTLMIRGAMVVPIISAVASGVTTLAGLWPSFDVGGRFQGMHIPPFLAGFCVTAIFAATLEYLRGFQLRWLVIGGIDLAILMLTQARAPLMAVALFLGLVFLLSGRHIFPLKRKVDLAIGGMVPGMLALGPALYFALDRVAGMSGDMSGRDIIWPYFLGAIRARPLFGFGLGAGKLIVNPEDPTIRLLGSNAAHNEYLRLHLPLDHRLDLDGIRQDAIRRSPGDTRRPAGGVAPQRLRQHVDCQYRSDAVQLLRRRDGARARGVAGDVAAPRPAWPPRGELREGRDVCCPRTAGAGLKAAPACPAGRAGLDAPAQALGTDAK
jgi:hypothetical protein